MQQLPPLKLHLRRPELDLVRNGPNTAAKVRRDTLFIITRR